MNDTGRSILVADDDTTFRERLARALAKRGYDVRAASSEREAIDLATEDSPELAVVDLRLGEDNGLALVAELKRIDATTSIVVLTGFGSIATALEAVKRGATHYLTKPSTVDEILAAFDRAEPIPAGALEHDDVPSLARVEWEHIQRVMVHCDHNVSQAARLLGLHRRSLQRKLSKFPQAR